MPVMVDKGRQSEAVKVRQMCMKTGVALTYTRENCLLFAAHACRRLRVYTIGMPVITE